MTVSEYLQKKKQDNPDFATLSDFSLYEKLQSERDPNLPKLELGTPTTPTSQRKGQTAYQRKVNPDTVNAMFDWTDLGINDDSAPWAKAAYNNSITGLAYQLYNGEQRFNLDGYNPGMVSDIFSSVLSFMMPMDFATMFVGGAIGKGMSGLAGYGMRTAATENLVKLGGKEALKKQAAKKLLAEGVAEQEVRKRIATGWARDIIEDGGYSALLSKFAPKTAGAIAQGGTLATFEGVRGGMSAAVNDEDIWEGIGHGVMHGGIMGGLAGAVGASLNIKNAALWNKQNLGQKLTPKEARQIGFWRTGKGGQVLAEAGVFTAPEVKNLITDEDYSMRDLFKAFGTNAGMMGVLKVQHHYQAKAFKEAKSLWNEGKESLKDYWNNEGKYETQAKENAAEALKAVAEQTGIDVTELQTSSKKELKKEVERFENKQLEHANTSKKERDNWEKDFDQATKDLERWQKDEIELNPEKLHNIYTQIQAVYGAMKRNIRKWKHDNPDITQAREAKLKEMELLADKWKTEIIDKVNNIESVKRENKKYTQKEISQKTDKAKQTFAEAWEKASESQRKNLRQGLENKITEKGEIKDATDFELIQQRADTLLEIKRTKDPTILTEPKIEVKQRVKDEVVKRLDTPETIKEDIVKEHEAGLIDSSKRQHKESLNEADIRIQNTKLGKEGSHQRNAYNESKNVLAYIARKLIPGRKKGVTSTSRTELNHLDKLAKKLAEDGRTLLEIKDKDILSYVQNTAIPQRAITKLLDAFKAIKSELDAKNKDLFTNLRYFDLIKLEGQNLYDAIGKMYDVGKKGGKGEGLQVPEGKESGFEIIKDDTITIRGKTRTYTKYITDKLKDGLDYLIQKTRTLEGPVGHKDYLYRDIIGEAFTTKEINILTKLFMGKRKLSSGDFGEGRLFRNSIAQWANQKLKPEDAMLIDAFVLGHGSEKTMFEIYTGKMKPSEAKRRVKELIKEYVKDINNPKGFKSSDRHEGYSTNEIRKGLKKLEKHEGDITFKDRNGETRTVDKKTVEAMFQYMIETGPRLNEIAPSPEALKARVKYASGEKTKTDRQLLTEAKTADALVKASELVQQVKWVKKKFPNLVVQIHKTLGKHRGDYVLGQIQGHLIKIAKGKARIDTLPHEVSHHVVDVLKSMGDPFSKKLVKEGIKMFKGEEAFVEALGKYVSKQLPKGKMGRMKSWISRTWNHLRQYFGLTSEKNVLKMQKELVSIIGGKVLSGKIPTDVMPLKSKLKIKYQTSDTNVGKKLVKKAKDNALDIEKQLIKEHRYTKEELREVGENLIGKKDWDKLSVSDIERYTERLNIIAGNTIEGKSKTSSLNQAKVKEIETRYDISDVQRDAFFKDIYNTTIDKANDIMIKSYKSYIIKGKEIRPITDTSVDANLAIIENKKIPSIGMFGRAFMTAADVVYKYGGKPGKLIAEKLYSHDATRSFLKGEGEAVSRAIEKIVTDKKTRNNYMHMLDGDLARGALKDIARLHKEFAKDNPGKKNPWTVELNDTAQAIKDFAKGGKYYEARELWQGLSNANWKTLIKYISLNTRGNKEFQEIKRTLDKKFINQYFARRVTKEALTHINKESPQIERLVKENIKKLSRNELKKAASLLKIKKNSPEYKELMEGKGKALENLMAEELIAMMDFGPAKVKPAFLKERGAQLPEYMEITVDGRKKLIKTYESSLDGTINSYVNGMAKYLATVIHFPEYTELKGKFSLGGDAKLANLEMMAKKGDTMGAYASETIKRQLGLDYSAKDVLMNPALEKLGYITNVSAVVGLSSPMAGLKNLLIQMPRSAAIYGTRNTVRAISFALKAFKDPKLFEQAIKRGEIGYGTRELVSSEIKGKTGTRIKWWFDNVNYMTKTENFNRIVTAEAGRLHFAELTNVARGTKSMFHPQGKPAEVLRMFKENWKLSDSDIKFIMEGKNIFETTRYQKILKRVGFESHKSAAGATGVADLPLWMSGRYVKPFTLFQRMATSVTIDSYKNYVKPLKNRNVAPLLKAAIGHGLSGAALFWMYDTFMGQQIPTEENPPLDRAISYLWKGEFLGMFGEIITPYDKGLSSPIMEPVIYRNAKNVWSEVSQMLNYGKSYDQALQDFSLKTVVLLGQAEKMYNKVAHPYVTNSKRIKTLRNQFNDKMGYETPQGNFLSSRQPYYWKLKKSIMFGKSDAEIARTYWSAFNYIVTDFENKGITSKSLREKKARQAIDAVIRNMHPINLPDDSTGRIDSKRNEFLNYLSAGNKALALKLEKEFMYRERAFRRIIRNNKWKSKYSIYTY